MIIRDVEARDIPYVVKYAQDFMEYYPVPLDYNIDDLMQTLIQVAENGIFLVAEKDGIIVGGLGAIVAPHYYAPMHLIASELFLWVDEGHRNSTIGPRLLKSFEEVAEEVGCKYISMTSTVRTPNFKDYLERKGYREAETSYLREV